MTGRHSWQNGPDGGGERTKSLVENEACGGSWCSTEASVDEEEAVGAEAKGPGLTLGSLSMVGVF